MQVGIYFVDDIIIPDNFLCPGFLYPEINRQEILY